MPDNIPKSLYHYTSFEAVTKILGIEFLKKEQLSFRFSNPLQTNDPREVKFFEDHVFNTKTGKELKDKIDSIKSDIGDPFTLSLIYHKQREDGERCLSTEIPMWKMYGDNFKGVRLRFSYKKLSEYCESSGNLSLNKCVYKQKTDMTEHGRTIRNSKQDLDLESIYRQSILYKVSDWEYENEYRLIKWCKDLGQRDFVPTTGKIYIPMTLPLSSLEAIEIGPKADQPALEGSLNLLKSKYDLDIKVSKSKLEIGYV